RPAEVRPEQLHALTRLRVGKAVALMAHNVNHGACGRALFNHGADRIHEALRLCPLAIEPRCLPLAPRHEIIIRSDSADRHAHSRRCERINFPISVEIELEMVGLISPEFLYVYGA